VQYVPDSFEIFTSQLTPNGKEHMPKVSPQLAVVKGMLTVPPLDSF
jgi:hypothetical protein